MAKPTHLPFSDWIQSGEPLTPEQNRALQEHLRACPECSQVQAALFEIQLLFQSSGMVAPAAGFAERWQRRQSLRRIQQQHRNTWILFFATALMAVFLLSFVVLRALVIFSSPAVILSWLVYLWTVILVTAENARVWIWELARFLPSLSYLGLAFFIGFNSLMMVLWWVAYQQFTSGRRWVS